MRASTAYGVIEPSVRHAQFLADLTPKQWNPVEGSLM